MDPIFSPTNLNIVPFHKFFWEYIENKLKKKIENEIEKLNHEINSIEKGMSQNPQANVCENANVEETPKRKPKLSKAKLKELKDAKTIKAFEKDCETMYFTNM